MNPVLLHCASGDSLYVGAVLLVVAIATSRYLERTWLLRLRNITAWLGLVMIVMASPPFSWVIDAIFLASFGLWFLASNMAAPGLRGVKLRYATTWILIIFLLVFSGVELSHRRLPVITGAASDHLVVIGDSISSGIDSRVPAWPLILQDTDGVKVKNLARPGAQVAEGQAMADGLTPEDRVVLIEIGGNDLLGGVPSDKFGSGLDTLLAKVATPGRTVVMFELPLLPHKIAYGQLQRRLAAKYRVSLIPKRYFTAAIGDANGTVDGLHLSDTGAHRMAKTVAAALSPVLESHFSNRE